MKNFKNFLIYNNTVPLILGFVFLGTTATFAASEDAREVVLSSEQSLTSVDNTFIRNVNLDTYTVEVSVNSVEEDGEYYYISYLISSVGLVDGVWQPTTEERILEISKASLGDNDLGLLVSKELSDIYESERRLLQETQEIEKKIGRTDKVVTTKYDGIVGRRLDPENQVFPGYDPVVTPPPAIPGPKPKQIEEKLDSGEVVIIKNPQPKGESNTPTSEPVTETEPTQQPAGTSTASTTPGATPGEQSTSTTPAVDEENPTIDEEIGSTTTVAQTEESGATSTEPTQLEAQEPETAAEPEPQVEASETTTEPESETSQPIDSLPSS